jgi:hypothetical protein
MQSRASRPETLHQVVATTTVTAAAIATVLFVSGITQILQSAAALLLTTIALAGR